MDQEEKNYMFLDKNSAEVDKNDLVKVFGHPNVSVNGTNYVCLRLWRLSENLVECLQDNNGIVKHIVVDAKYVEKLQ